MAHMWTKRHRDHVLRSQTHPGVEPILEDVDQPPLGYDFDLRSIVALPLAVIASFVIRRPLLLGSIRP
jgi:hypothetical protein